MEKNKKIRLNKAYKQQLKTLAASSTENSRAGLMFFAEHLKYLRDCLILTDIHNIEQEPVKTNLATITTALAEFYAYQRSEDATQKSFHWNNFCDFVKLNMEEWLMLNDSI